MNYEVVKRNEVPSDIGKWRALFDPLKYNEAIKINLASKKEARLLAGSISQTLRYAKANYKIHYRSVPTNDGFTIYLWKEAISGVK